MKMKKPIALALALLSVICLFSSCGKDKGKFDGMSYEITDEGTVTITGYTDKTTVTELAVPDEIDGHPVTKIDDFGICNAESLTKLTIGRNVSEIAGWGLTNNQHIAEYIVDPANKSFRTVDGVIFSADMKTLYYYPCGKDIEFDRFGQNQNTTTYSIPDGVETVRTKAFYKCYYVDVDYFPDSITSIEEKAFHRCSALTDFEMPDNLRSIGKDAFAYDEGLTAVEIPATIEEIGEYAFFNCRNITSVKVMKAKDQIVLGNKWEPTDKGKIKDDCSIEYVD